MLSHSLLDTVSKPQLIRTAPFTGVIMCC